jgi:mono/diheme cytochrome c family protein
MSTMVKKIMVCFVPLLLLSCQKAAFQEDKIFVGQKIVSKDVLNQGHLTYLEYCVSCHGVKGDGKGISSKGLYPPPRNFTLGLFKFGTTLSGELPRDEDLMKIIRHGLNGSAMLPWDISDERLYAVTQYIKTFAPTVWEQKDKALAPQVTLTPDPFVANKSYAVEKGKEVYHTTASCYTCHRAYVSYDELNALSLKVNNQPAEADETIYQLKLQDSQYGVAMIPPDYTWHSVRSADTVEDIAIRLASGVGGTSMPSWKGVLDDEDIWATAYYVKSLINMKGQNTRDQLIQKIQRENLSRK